jgi:glycosyltransferase involved in cell wall biosynthesis
VTAGARIALVIDGALETRSGGYLYDRIVVERLRAGGDEVTIVSLPTEARHFGKAHRRARETLADRSFDAVVIDELCHPRTTLAAIGSRLERSPRPRLVTLVHHLAASERSGISRLVRLGIEQTLLAASDRIVATSDTTRELLAKLGIAKRKLFVAKPGCDRLGVALTPPKPGDVVRCVFLGALTSRKDPLAAIEAFRRVEGPARLTMIGPTDRDEACASEVRRRLATLGERARLLGELDDEAVARELHDADVLIMPSHYEGYGIAAAEAQAHGLLVIASRAGALPEVLRDGSGAVLVELGDAPGLRRAIGRAASDRRWLEDQKRLALTRARSLPRWSDTAESFRAAVLA